MLEWEDRTPLSQRDRADDPLPSWNDGPTRKSILDFVARVTQAGGPDFVAPEERIATFDNDGTLWAEYPLPFQLFFAFDQIKAMAPRYPEWRDKEPFKSVLASDLNDFSEHQLLRFTKLTREDLAEGLSAAVAEKKPD